MNKLPLITNIQKFSVHDGPGIRSIIFSKGCPLNCVWCANPENINYGPEIMYYKVKCIGCGKCIDRCPNEAIILYDNKIINNKEKCNQCGKCTEVCNSKARVLQGQEYSIDEVINKINKDYLFYKNSGGGITFSGGEPLLFTELILKITRYCKEKGLNSTVETCGYVPWENFGIIEPWVDLFLYDLKFINEQKHIKYCNKSNDLILENFKNLCKNNDVILRIPIIPEINDTDEDIALTGKFLSTFKDKIKEIHCLPYHNYGASKYDALDIEYKMHHIKVPDNEYMTNVKDKFKSFGIDVKIGG